MNKTLNEELKEELEYCFSLMTNPMFTDKDWIKSVKECLDRLKALRKRLDIPDEIPLYKYLDL